MELERTLIMLNQPTANPVDPIDHAILNGNLPGIVYHFLHRFSIARFLTEAGKSASAATSVDQ